MQECHSAIVHVFIASDSKPLRMGGHQSKTEGNYVTCEAGNYTHIKADLIYNVYTPLGIS
jgi:hypothetical protein